MKHEVIDGVCRECIAERERFFQWYSDFRHGGGTVAEASAIVDAAIKSGLGLPAEEPKSTTIKGVPAAGGGGAT